MPIQCPRCHANLELVESSPQSGAPSPSPDASGRPTTLPPYGRSKGAPIAGASAGDLDYYASGCRRTLADPAKARWHEKEKLMLAAIEAEQGRQAGGAPGAPTLPSDPGQPTSDGGEIPFAWIGLAMTAAALMA